MSNEELWNLVLGELELNTTKASFITWFQYVYLMEFKNNFAENKKILGNNTMPSKKIRNKVAGYIARLKKAEKAENK